MAEKILSVVIVGGSLTALFHGIVLKDLGHNVLIFERSTPETLSAQGAGIIARDEVQAFFRKYDHVKQPYFVHAEPKVKFLTRDAKEVTNVWMAYVSLFRGVLSTRDVQLAMTSWDTLYYRLRANFDGLQIDHLNGRRLKEDRSNQAITYQVGRTVLDLKYSTTDGIVTVIYGNSDGSGDTMTTDVDLVIAADGPNSSIRNMIYPEIERSYAGYAAWRGTVPEGEVSEAAKQLFGSRCNFFKYSTSHMLLYTIPGKEGSLHPGNRLLNYVWYCSYPEGSAELDNLMTDKNGHRHRYSMPMGKIRPEIWAEQRRYAKDILPFAFAELVEKTEQPFVQCITDVSAPRAVHLDGHLLLTGDALCTFRPHVGASTNQAALHALLLEKVLTNQIMLHEWEHQVLQYAKITSLTSTTFGNKYQFGFWTFFGSAVKLTEAYIEMYAGRAWEWVKWYIRGRV